MLKSIFTTCLVLAAVGVLANDAHAAGRRRQCSPNYVVATAAVTTAPVATAQTAPTGQGYRTYSYEPSAAIAPYSTMRRTMRVPPHTNAGGHTAGYKLTDF